ncbi:hypothetical protein FLM9_1444 [Candidatus Synechococcus spongiarum]|uniref:Uncharacterized protein n=1 Tax=Candidatus Synechococcus spongiarum TaxID=431041 RepID=A0A164ZSI4_9SYNE|nr:hypothetical protein FLM9_1444 [Candidatus Synechococcus spongiarum]
MWRPTWGYRSGIGLQGLCGWPWRQLGWGATASLALKA